MTKEQAIERVISNYDDLLKKQNSGYNRPKKEAIWFYTTDHADSYEVNEEWLGVTANGKIAWAYASGCSCWDGDYDEKICEDTSMKNFEFHHEDMEKEWEDKLIEFAKNIN